MITTTLLGESCFVAARHRMTGKSGPDGDCGGRNVGSPRLQLEVFRESALRQLAAPSPRCSCASARATDLCNVPADKRQDFLRILPKGNGPPLKSTCAEGSEKRLRISDDSKIPFVNQGDPLLDAGRSDVPKLTLPIPPLRMRVENENSRRRVQNEIVTFDRHSARQTPQSAGVLAPDSHFVQRHSQPFHRTARNAND
jgi:hypothetical protein